ncbi:hypothetical protein WDV93_21830 [Pantoea ananatis]
MPDIVTAAGDSGKLGIDDGETSLATALTLARHAGRPAPGRA